MYNSFTKLQLLPKSPICICNNHGDCKGLLSENEILRNFCSCNCHDRSYQLIRNSIAANNVENLGNYAPNQNLDY